MHRNALALMLSLFAACAGEDLAAATVSLGDIVEADGAAPVDASIEPDGVLAACGLPGSGACDDVEAPPDVSDSVLPPDAVEASDTVSATPDAASVVPSCPPGLSGCSGDQRLACSEDGATFTETPCTQEQGGPHCWDGECVECAINAHCPEGTACDGNSCVAPALKAVVEALPVGKVGVAYSATLEATGGVPPYQWKAVALPPGLALDAGGVLSGIPEAAGETTFDATVADSAGAFDTATWTVVVTDGSLAIVTSSPLPKAIEGEPYSVSFAASGGETPYFWGLVGGAPPPGLSLSAAGVLSGVATEGGDFTFTVKALDNGSPTATAQKAFTLPVSLAPLEIIGEQEVNLFVTKLITLPLIVVVSGLPVPYNAKLAAKGGKKPYTWAEEPLPGFVSSFIPKSGVPAGLTLAPDGTLSGGVSDPSLVNTITVPFTQIKLSGFFFQAKVTDSQNPSESKAALFIIPTVPIGQ